MTNQKLDRRVARTKAVLREALFALIEEKGYGTITVSDIAERADVNRVTFYFHYKDKEDLLFEIMKEVYDELAASLPASTTASEWLYEDALAGFRHVQQYSQLYKVLLSEKGTLSLIGRFIDLFAAMSISKAREHIQPGTVLPVPLEISEQYYAGAFVALVRWWVIHDMPRTPEEMARLCEQLELHNSLWAWGVEGNSFP